MNNAEKKANVLNVINYKDIHFQKMKSTIESEMVIDTMKLFWLSFLLYVPIFYMGLFYTPFECPAFLHNDSTFSLVKAQLVQKFTVSYCHATFIEYVHADDKIKVEQYIKANPRKTFYYTSFGHMGQDGINVLRIVTIVLVSSIFFMQFLTILEIQEKKRIKKE
jgi:hypothetical protein